MGFRINRGIFQKLEADGRTYTNAFKVGEDGRLKEVDADGNPIGDYLKVGDKASDADFLDGVNSSSFLRSDTSDSFTGGNLKIDSSGQYRVFHGKATRAAGLGTGSAGSNTPPFLFENTKGNQAWGVVAEFRLNEDNEGGDSPAIMFSDAQQSTQWTIGFDYTGSEFGIRKNRGIHSGGWGTSYFKINTSGNVYIPETLEVDNKIYADNGLHVRADWVRVDNQNGIYFESYGGGWHMSDSTWIKAYNSKSIYTPSDIRADSRIYVGSTHFLDGTRLEAIVNTLQSTSLPYYSRLILNGDPDLFYPVHFRGGDQDVWRRIIIKRGYGAQAPWDPIGTGLHHGGLLLDWEGNFGGWGGAQYSDRLRVLNESYTNIVADMYRYTHSMGYVFFLRGGGDTGALYDIYSDQPINGTYQSGTPDVGYDPSFKFYDHSNTNYIVYAPEPIDMANINSRRLDELKTLKRSQLDALYQPVGNYLGATSKAADSNLLDGIDSSSFLRSDANDTASGKVTFTYQDSADPLATIELRGNGNHSGLYINPFANKQAHVRFASNGALKWQIRVPFQDGVNSEMKIYSWVDGADRFRFSHNGDFSIDGDLYSDEVRSRNYWISNALYFGGGNNYVNWTDSNRIYANASMQIRGGTNGMALQVGNGSTNGVYANDMARSATVIGGDYYPHLFISPSGSNNTNHGGVLSFVGTEGSAARQWNMGTSNQNPFLFSIGYNATGDNNPHYGLGDNWSNNDSHHARLLIDRGGNVKIRGSLYVNGTKGGITTGNKVATETYAANAAAGVNTRIDEEVLPAVAQNATDIGRNATDIATKANASGSYGQDFYVDDLYYDAWIRNHTNTNGIYWNTTGWHLYPQDNDDFLVRSGNSGSAALRFNTGGTSRNYVYCSSSNEIGFLTSSRSWALRVDNSKNTQIYNNLTVNGGVTAASFSGDGSGLTGISAGAPPVQTTSEVGEPSTLVSIHFSPGEGAATFTLANGESYRLAFAR